MDSISVFIFLILGITGIGLLIWGIVVMGNARAEKLVRETLNASGVGVEGEVMELTTKGQTLEMILGIIGLLSLLTGQAAGGGGSSLSYHITVGFPVPHGDKTKTCFVTRRVYRRDAHRVGDKVQIRYLPESPETARLAVETQSRVPDQTLGRVLVILGVFIVVLGGVLGVANEGTVRNRHATSTAYTLLRSATPNVSQKTATADSVTATAVADSVNLKALQDAFRSDLERWKQVDDLKAHRAEDTRSLANFIDYGRCGSRTFYAFFWKRVIDRITINNVLTFYYAGYGYYENASPDTCYPKEVYSQVWPRRNNGDLGGGWYAIQGAIDIKLQK